MALERVTVRTTAGTDLSIRKETGAGGTGRVAVLLPGAGYTFEMPLLTTSWRVLGELGYTRIGPERYYGKDPSYARLAPDAQRDAVKADLAAIWSLVGEPAELLLLGKSIGTSGMAMALQHPPGRSPTRLVWLTPLLNDDAVVACIAAGGPPDLVVIGTADPVYDRAKVAQLAAQAGVQVQESAGADHGMTVAGDAAATAAILEDYDKRLSAFAKIG